MKADSGNPVRLAYRGWQNLDWEGMRAKRFAGWNRAGQLRLFSTWFSSQPGPAGGPGATWSSSMGLRRQTILRLAERCLISEHDTRAMP
jgi:hypothetical protein